MLASASCGPDTPPPDDEQLCGRIAELTADGCDDPDAGCFLVQCHAWVGDGFECTDESPPMVLATESAITAAGEECAALRHTDWSQLDCTGDPTYGPDYVVSCEQRAPK